MSVKKNNRLSWSCALVLACAIPAGCVAGSGSGKSDDNERSDGQEQVAESSQASTDPCGLAPGCNPSIGPADYKISPSLVLSRSTESITGLTDDTILDAVFPLKDVVFQLLVQAGTSTSQSPDEWLSRLWDTQNAAPSVHNETYQPHCSDNGSTINGFPIDCARPEGQLAGNVTTTDFKPIGAFNRFDLAPEDGSHCGEYRIVYAMENFTSGKVQGRNFIIFEGQLPNPSPDCGIQACRPVVDFWSSLSSMSSQGAIAKALRMFYFKGLPGFDPVIKLENYGFKSSGGGGYGNGGGQIRTNQFVDGILWQLREFQLDLACEKPLGCRLFSQPVTVKNNPFFDLFDMTSTDPRMPAFQSSFVANVGGVSQVTRLATTHTNPITHINLISMDISNKLNAGQSTSQGLSEAYVPPYSVGLPHGFESNIQTELTNAGSLLTPDEVIHRAQAMGCHGCHSISDSDNQIGGGVTWPNSNGFTHIDEFGTLSQALRCVFLPHRQAVGIGFLQDCGSNPDPIPSSDPDCKDFSGGNGGYDGAKFGPADPKLVEAALEAGAPSPIKPIGGGAKF